MITHIKHFYLAELAKQGFNPTQIILLNLVLTFRNTREHLRMGQTAIAEHIGLTRKMVHVNMKKLQEAGWIKIKAHKVKGSKEQESNEYTPTTKLLTLLGISKSDTGRYRNYTGPGIETTLGPSIETIQYTSSKEEEVNKGGDCTVLSVPSHLNDVYKKYVKEFGHDTALRYAETAYETKTQIKV